MMKRRTFSKALLSLGTMAMVPGFRLPFETNFEEIIGKRKPALFGDGFQLRKEAANAFEHRTLLEHTRDYPIDLNYSMVLSTVWEDEGVLPPHLPSNLAHTGSDPHPRTPRSGVPH